MGVQRDHARRPRAHEAREVGRGARRGEVERRADGREQDPLAVVVPERRVERDALRRRELGDAVDNRSHRVGGRRAAGEANEAIVGLEALALARELGLERRDLPPPHRLALHVAERASDRIPVRRSDEQPRRAELERLLPALDLDRMHDRVHRGARAERRDVMAEGQRRAALDAKLDEGNVRAVDARRVDRLLDGRHGDEEIALLADDVLDRIGECPIPDEYEDPKGPGAIRGRAHRSPEEVGTVPRKTNFAGPRIDGVALRRHADAERSAEEVHGHLGASRHPALRDRDGDRGASPGPAGLRDADPALPDDEVELGGGFDHRELDVRAVREVRVLLDARTNRLESPLASQAARVIACGLPASPSDQSNPSSRTSPVCFTTPMSMVTISPATSQRLVPAPVSKWRVPSVMPRRRATWSATQRRPFPHISGIDPSAFMTTIRPSTPEVWPGSTSRTPSAPMPRRRSQSLRASSRLTARSSAASITTKSLPSPFVLLELEGKTTHASVRNDITRRHRKGDRVGSHGRAPSPR